MLAVLLTIALLALPGHIALCLWLNNNINARVVRRGVKHCVNLPLENFLAFGPLALVASIALGYWPMHPSAWNAWQTLTGIYLLAAAGVAVAFVPRWVYRQVTARPPAVLLSNHTTTLDLAPQLQGRIKNAGLGRFYAGIPKNQSLTVAVHEKSLEIPRLPAALDGVSITHLSDLHFTGRVGKAYFEEVVTLANGLESDLIAITGDVVDASACLDWLPDTLGRLRARHGVYFVLGNHDVRAGHEGVRRVLTDCGLIDLSGRWLRTTLRGQGIILAGNELPWIKPAADMSTCPVGENQQRDFRILLSHSPDQHEWAQAREIDLMLAGHTHGGQIRFPLIGPILAPSRYGVRYASGVFHLPPMVMHVSRGLSGLQPLRFNCPPELAKLVLRSES